MANILTCASLAATRSRSLGYSAYRSTSVCAADGTGTFAAPRQQVEKGFHHAHPQTLHLRGRRRQEQHRGSLRILEPVPGHATLSVSNFGCSSSSSGTSARALSCDSTRRLRVRAVAGPLDRRLRMILIVTACTVEWPRPPCARPAGSSAAASRCPRSAGCSRWRPRATARWRRPCHGFRRRCCPAPAGKRTELCTTVAKTDFTLGGCELTAGPQQPQQDPASDHTSYFRFDCNRDHLHAYCSLKSEP